MVRLSVNVNKIATLRNSRSAQSGLRSTGYPSVVQATRICVEAGATGITVHPRPDARHITLTDVREVAAFLAPMRDRVEYNIEGDPRPELMDLVTEIRPHQVTLVPVRPGEITSQAGWAVETPPAPMRALIERMHAVGVRVSVFVDPLPAPIDWAADLGADRIELFTEPFAQAFARNEAEGRESFETYVAAAEHAHARGLGINAGHDLDADNLPMFGGLPHLDEVSIGHAIVGDAVFEGLAPVIRRYLDVLP
ncbi:MAG: pyridoxine 5'-phosphate synthase [Nannocystaceae bacterium]|nr:pyridoxine 5'-phosphate synthase [Nannocystaceae bacterium]